MSDPDTPNFDELVAFAHELADLSAKAILPHFRQSGAVEDKSGSTLFDPVTQADKAAEEVIRESVVNRWPDHDLLGEEFGLLRGSSDGEAEYCWIVDPIDGTRSFITGMPIWGSLIGLNRNEKPVFGLINQPFTGERFWNTKEGAWYRGPDGERQLKTRPCATLSDATLLCTTPDMFPEKSDLAKFEGLAEKTRLRRFGGDCYCYGMLAAGQADLVVEASLQAYDIAPLIPIVEYAGGRITTWDGGNAAKGGRIVASGDPALHDTVLEFLTG